jgi:hypothetical protein
MALENERKGAQSKSQNDGKLQNGTKTQSDAKSQDDKGQNLGKPVTGVAETAIQNSKGQDDRYVDASGDESDEQETTQRYHRRIINSCLKGDKKYDIQERKYQLAKLKLGLYKQHIIHQLLRKLQELRKGAPPEALAFIEDTVLQKPKFFTDADDNEKVPMLEAAKSLPAVLFRVLDLLIADSAREKIMAKCADGHKCPLWDVAEGRRKQCQLKKSSRDVNGSGPNGQIARSATLKASDNLGGGAREDKNRCLHDDIDVKKLLDENKKLKDILEEALKPAAKSRECLQSLISETKFDPDQKVPQLIRLESFKILLSLCHGDVFGKDPEIGYSPLQRAVRLLNGESLDFQLLYDVIRALVEHCPASIFCKANVNGTSTTAYRLLKELKQANKTPGKEEWIQRSDELLTERCIGYRELGEDPATNTWARKRDLMYWDPKTGKLPIPRRRVARI